MLKQAWTLKDLAAMCGIDPAGLAETVERFNENAGARRRPRLRAGRVGLQPGPGRSEPQGAPLPRAHRRGPVLRLPGRARATSAPAAASSPTSTPRSSTRTAGRSTGSTPPATAPPPSWAATTSDPGASIANTMVFGYLAARHAAGAGAPGS